MTKRALILTLKDPHDHNTNHNYMTLRMRKKKISFCPRLGFEPGTSKTWTTAYHTYYIGYSCLTVSIW